jgi:indole-3-glycerol phosphate synthase
MTQERELKKQLRALRKLKRQTQPHTVERRQLNRQIRELKTELATRDEVLAEAVKDDAPRQAVIAELERAYQSKFRPVVVDFRAYTVDQLKVHLEKVKRS